MSNLNSKTRKIYCAIIVLVGAASIFAWHLCVNEGRHKWLITWLAVKDRNSSTETKLPTIGTKLLMNAKSLRYGLYIDLKKSLKKMRNSNNSRANPGKTEPETFPRKVLIISSGRSGSSFLGDLFNQNKKTLYLFEPLGWSVKTDFKEKEAKKFQVLNDLFNCKFSEKIYLEFLTMKDGQSFRKKSNKISTFPGQCPRISKNSSRCLSKILKSLCLSASSVVAKVLTHRLPGKGLWGIQEILDANKNLRIVHLIRDPRRVIASMRAAGWFKGKNFASKVQYICSLIWANVQHVRNESSYYNNRYKLVVFTDMMLNPFSTVVELYNFLNLGPVPEYIFSWIVRNTMASKDFKKQTYKTSRNSTEVLSRKVDFSEVEKTVIDKYCGNIIELLKRVRKNSL